MIITIQLIQIQILPLTTLTKSTDHGDDINPGIDPESETQNESQMSESNNITTETKSERSEHRKYRQVSEKLWPWLYLNENKMFCKVCMKAGKKNTMTIGCTTFKTIKLLKPKVKGPNIVNIDSFRKNFGPGFT